MVNPQNIINHLFSSYFPANWPLIVYCYCSSGNNDDNNFLIWERRNKIANDIARALEFLHLGGVTQSVIHGDVKSSNVLLSEDFGARVNTQIKISNT